MPRKRMIDPEFWSDEKVGILPIYCRLLFIGMWNFADDEGLIRYSPSFIKSMIFPYDRISLKKIGEYMDVLEKNDFVISYIGGLTKQRYAYIINFRKYQRIDKPQASKLPPPSLQNPEIRRMYAKRDNEICHICKELVKMDARVDLPKSKAPSMDHVVPKNMGGSNYPSNIKLAHISCNKGKCDDWNDSKNDSENDSRLREVKRREEKLKETNIVKLNNIVKPNINKESSFKKNFVNWDVVIPKKLQAIATKDRVKNLMRQMPQNLWWKVDKYLTKRYPGGGNSFTESESELIRELQDNVIN